jgi:hypothetical protein
MGCSRAQAVAAAQAGAAGDALQAARFSFLFNQSEDPRLDEVAKKWRVVGFTRLVQAPDGAGKPDVGN